RVRIRDGKCVVGKTIEYPELIELSERILTKLNFSGPCNIQFIKSDDKLYCIEVNPRLAAGSLPLAIKAGLNIPEMMIRFSLGEELENISYERDMYMVRSLDSYYLKTGD
ncbi:MAG: ATP-grasp domain-containing protein, partial [Patescibacteria group bacterium]